MAFEFSNETLYAVGTAFIGIVLGAGKYIRSQRSESASTNAAVSASQASEAASKSVTEEVKRLTDLVTMQGKQIDALKAQIDTLQAQLLHTSSGKKTALKLLHRIHLCNPCDATYAVLLDSAIEALEEDTDAKPSQF